MSKKILVIDDDETNCRLMRAIFATEGFDVSAANDGPSGIVAANDLEPDLVLLDLNLPKMGGLEVLEKLKGSHPDTAIIVITGHAQIKTAVRTAQLGAFDYLTKPIDRIELLAVARRAMETADLRAEVSDLRKKLGEGGSLAEMMGPSAQTRQVIDQVRTAAPSNFTVLILGATGSGKEVVAQAIYRESDRRQKPFIAIDCGAIPETLLESELFGHERGAFSGADRKKKGQFQLAHGGTLFLDEIGNLPINLQVKLLRVLESRQFQPIGAARSSPMDVRFMAATNYDLQERVSQGHFRPDLYFRLAQYTIVLNALKDRIDDIPYLAQKFMKEASIELRRPVQKIADDAVELLLQYEWPGNVRELKNVIQQAVLQSKELVLTRDSFKGLSKKKVDTRLSSSGIGSKSLRQAAADAAQDAERAMINEALRITLGNKSQAARQLQTDYKTLHLKMKALGIRARDFVP